MERNNFDVFVIGSGGAGQTVAEACAKNGLSVAVADHRVFGGTCANRGCDPKKVLLGATEIYEHSKNLQKKGIPTVPEIHWKRLQKFKRTFTKAVPATTESQLRELGIKLYHQSPEFKDKNTLSVEGKTVYADKIVLATGQLPRPLDFKGSDCLKTSDDFLDLKKLPKRIVFIGAGYVGMELAHIAARCGSEVTLIEHGERPLKVFDKDMVDHLIEASKVLGVRFRFNSKIDSIEELRKNLKINYTTKGEAKTLKVSMVVNTTGRIPAISKLNLAAGKVAFSEEGITVNKYLQSTTNPNVYACGDVSDHGLPLTSLTGPEATVVAENLIHKRKKAINVPSIPSSVFTLPNLASVGLSEQEAERRFKKIAVSTGSVPQWYNAKRINAPSYAYKIISNHRTKVIVGAHLLAPNASETINLFAMAINMGLTTKQLKEQIFTYPSWSNDVKYMV